MVPFPCAPYFDGTFDKVCNAAYKRYAGTDDEEPGLSMSCGVITLEFHDNPPRPVERAEQVAELIEWCGIEASEIEPHVVWTVMRKTTSNAHSELSS